MARAKESSRKAKPGFYMTSDFSLAIVYPNGSLERYTHDADYSVKKFTKFDSIVITKEFIQGMRWEFLCPLS